MIEALPRSSHFVQAMADDPEFAERVVATAGADDKREPRVRLVDYTPDVEMLTNIYDRLGEVIVAVVAAAGAKRTPKFKPAPRPTTAIDEARRRRRWTQHKTLASRLLPGRSDS